MRSSPNCSTDKPCDLGQVTLLPGPASVSLSSKWEYTDCLSGLILSMQCSKNLAKTRHSAWNVVTVQQMGETKNQKDSQLRSLWPHCPYPHASLLGRSVPSLHLCSGCPLFGAPSCLLPPPDQSLHPCRHGASFRKPLTAGVLSTSKFPRA